MLLIGRRRFRVPDANAIRHAVGKIWLWETLHEQGKSLEEELKEARPIRETVVALVKSVQEDIRNGRILDTEKLKSALADMVESIIRNPNALVLLTRLKGKDARSLGYAIDVAIGMLAFGRHLGFPRDKLQSLGLGGLLLDIGKVRLPEELLAKRATLTAEEHRLMKSHVQHGTDILNATQGIPQEVLEMVGTHHEREDGSGYPKGLRANEIGVPGKMAAIVDCFQDLTSGRSSSPPMSPPVALQLLHQWRTQFFHAYLVKEFIQCIGLYPVGSLVELNTGEVAVIMARNSQNRLKPKVMLVLDPEKQPYTNKIVVDLNTPNASQSREIRRGLEPGMYGINPHAYLPRD